MSFSALSREVRNLIYRALLCPPDGIRLRDSLELRLDKPDDEYDDDDEDEGHMVSIIPVGTSIFHVNRQIGQEATEILYGFNRFTFRAHPGEAMEFLKDLPSGSLRQIKNIGFTRRATCADDGDCKDYWEPLCDFITSHMHLSSVTIEVPWEPGQGTRVRGVLDGEWYWWPAAKLLRGLLMAGKIQKLRLGYNVALPRKIRTMEEEDQSTDAAQSPPEDPLEGLNAISNLREEDGLTMDETTAFMNDARERGESRSSAWIALAAEREKRMQRFDFVVTREDDPVGDVGTVLVLTKPKSI